MSNSAFPNDVPSGRTGVITNTTAYALLAAGTTATNPIQSLASAGTSGQVLVSGGASALPAFANSSTVGALQLIATSTASSSASITFSGLSSTYISYLIVATNVQPATNLVSLLARMNSDSSSNYTYSFLPLQMATSPPANTVGSSGDTSFSISQAIGNGGSNHANFLINIVSPNSTGIGTSLQWSGTYTGSTQQGIGGASGIYNSATPASTITFLMSSGNIAAGTFKLYGLLA